MAQYIFGARNKNPYRKLGKTLPMFQEAQEAVRRLVANKGTVLFVGTNAKPATSSAKKLPVPAMPFR